MSDDEIVAEFRANAEGVVNAARQDEIIAATWEFDQVRDLSEYMNLRVSM